MGVWVLPNANSLDVIAAVRKEMEAIQRELPTGMEATIAFDSTKYINSAIHEVDAARCSRRCSSSSSSSSCSSARSARCSCRSSPSRVSLIGAVFLMQVFGFTLNLLTLLAIVLSVGLVVDDAIVVVENVERHIREGKTPLRGGAHRRARAGRPDHRDDHHARRGLRADRLSGRPHRRALPRVRLHARGRGVHLRRRRAHALADDVVAAPLGRAQPGPLGARRSTRAFERDQAQLRARARPDARRRARRVYAVWIVLTLLIVPMYMFSPTELAPNEDQGVVFGAIDVPANATLEQLTPYTEADQPASSRSTPEFDHSFQITFPTGGFGGMLVKPWDERKRSIFPIQEELARKLWRDRRACARRRSCRRRCRAPGTFPVEFVIASTASHEELLALRAAARRTRR